MGYGVIGDVLDAQAATIAAGFHWAYADGPYFLRRKGDSTRICWDTQWYVMGDCDDLRAPSLEEKGCLLRDRQQRGDTIFVCPSHEAQHRKQDKEPVDRWIDRTIKAIKVHTDRPVEVRTKGADSDLNVRIESMGRCFDRAWAIVTAGSTIGCEAIAAGIPVFTDRRCAASPIANTDFAQIESPSLPSDMDRERWAHNLCARQFDTVDLRKGRAWRVIQEDLAVVESR